MMNRLRSILILALVLAACAACGGGGGSSPTEPAPDAVLLGTVHESGKTTLIPGVAIEAQGGRTMTDAGGAFTLRDLRPAQTTVTLTKEGYRETRIGVNLVTGENRFSIAMSHAP
jgi:Carboxypeptidase regulatory-like domain